VKGIVFTEFLEMTEERFSLGVVDQILRNAAPASGGQYTSVGTYPPSELVAMLGELSTHTGIDASALLKQFGAHLLRRFVQGYPQFFADAKTSFELLASVEDVIHVEVKKLYPDAELPSIVCEAQGKDGMLITYKSPRRLADLAEGLITACAEHYGDRVALRRDDLSGGSGEVVRFTLVREATV